MDSYVIAVRTYKRAPTFPKMTYRMLEHSNLTDRLYIFVANEDELALYKSSLTSKPYKAMVIGEIGGANATRAICNYFPIGQQIVFMDDDLEQFFEFEGDKHEKPFVKDSSRLGLYLEDGFRTIDTHNLGSFTFSFYQNRMFLSDKPFKQFRPFNVAGNFFGARNDRSLIPTVYSNTDDLVRSCRFIDRYGGTLVYWWAGFKTRTFNNPGGLYDERHNPVTGELRLNDCIDECGSDEFIRMYSTNPIKRKDGSWFMKIKPITQLRKILTQQGISHPELDWDVWFSDTASIKV